MSRDLAGEPMDDVEAGEVAVQLDDQPAEAVLAWALERFGKHVALCTSFQAEGMVLLDMAWRIDPGIRVFTIDTGRLHQETHDLIDQVRERYRIPIEVHSPDAVEVEAMTRRHGVNLFYRSVPNRLLCCQVRKVRPLQRVLGGLDAWITGLRRETWASRANIRKVEVDHDHGGMAKINPLADWTHDELMAYVRCHELPSHALYARGFTSIGCAPCTRATTPAEDPRAGRWWWETNAPKECGMHCTLETGSFEHEVEVLLDLRD
ncbi:MAG: phosphoadenylyl-sulfate reductase [Gemmatimonadota bacterium]